jgi:hypothetical protein
VKTDKTDDGRCVITKAHPGFDQSELQRQNNSVNINYLLNWRQSTKQAKMNNDDSPVLLYAHPSMYLLAEEIVNMCTVLSNGYSQSSQSERP